MKKTYSEKELKEKANQVFADYTAANTVFATQDGNVFLQENRARLHATPAGNVYPFHREQKSEVTDSEPKTTEPKPLNAIAAVAFIEVATSAEAILPFADDTRKTVKAAYEKRKKELEAVPATTTEPADNIANGTGSDTGSDAGNRTVALTPVDTHEKVV